MAVYIVVEVEVSIQEQKTSQNVPRAVAVYSDCTLVRMQYKCRGQCFATKRLDMQRHLQGNDVK